MRSARIALAVALAGVTLPVPSVAQERAAVDRGREMYQYWCATCHASGRGFPGTVALQAKYRGTLPPALEDRTDLTVNGIRFVVRRGTSIMPFFRKTEVSDPDLDAIAAYLRRPRPAPLPAAGQQR